MDLFWPSADLIHFWERRILREIKKSGEMRAAALF
jgi:hypothetical protein